MDVVASVGYTGQRLFFIDEERFAHTTGKGIYIYDTHKGPREIIWRHEKDMLYCSVNLEAQLLAFSFKAADQTLELVKLTDISNPIQVENPFKCAIIYHEITRLGDRLYGLSDVTDQHFTVWSVSKQPRVLTSKKLDSPCQKCLINPCDSDQVCLIGEDSIFLAQVSEVFGDYSLKFSKLYPAASDKEKHLMTARQTNDDSHSIKFVLWLPFHRLLIGLGNGEIIELHTETKTMKHLGRFVDPFHTHHGRTTTVASHHATVLYGTAAVLSANYLILGTKAGNVYWFSLGAQNYLNDVTATQSFMDEFHNPVRVARCGAGAISSLTVDPSVSVVIIGTIQGIITKANVEPEAQENDLNANNNANANNNDENENVKEKQPTLEQIPVEPIGHNNTMNGLVFSSKFISMNVKKTTTRARSSLSLLLLGYHSGLLNIWRHSESVGDMIMSGSAIRRSNPKAIQDLLRVETKSSNKNASAILFMEVIPYGYYYLLCIGFENGFLEFWSMNAMEFDEEEAKDNTNNNSSSQSNLTNEGGPDNGSPNTSNNNPEYSKIIEDDEGTCVVKLDFKYLMKMKMFNSAFTNFTLITSDSSASSGGSGAGQGSLDFKLAVSSLQDPQLYVLQLIRNNRLEIGKIFDFYDLTAAKNSFLATDYHSVEVATAANAKAPIGTIHSLIWLDEMLYSFLNNEKTRETLVLRHKLDLDSNKLVTDSSVIKLQGIPQGQTITKFVLSPLSNSAVAVSSTGIGFYLSFSDDLKTRLGWEKYKARKLVELKDLISLTTFAPSGMLFVTGSIDGNFAVWKIDPENYENIAIIHSVAIYSSPLINAQFSLSSSSIFSAALDGTSMTLFLGKLVQKGGRQASMAGFNNSNATASPAKLSTQQFQQNQHQLNQLLEKQQQGLYHMDHLDLKNTAIPAPGAIVTVANPEELLVAEKIAMDKEKELKASYKFKAMGITAAISEIQTRLNLLIDQNNDREEIEQLPLSDFVLDLRKKKDLEDNEKKILKNLNKQYFERRKALELLACRLKKFTWDTIEVHSLRIHPFLMKSSEIEIVYDPEGVSSYPILKISDQKKAIMEKMKRLRRLEIKTIRRSNDGVIRRIKGTEYYRCGWSANMRGIPSDINYVMNEGMLWPLTRPWETVVGQDNPNSAENAAETASPTNANTSSSATAAAGGKPGAAGAAAATAKGPETVNANPQATSAVSRDDDDENSFQDDNDEQEMDDHELLNLFYSPLITRSVVQKRNQIYLIQDVIKKEKINFNTKFKVLQNEKEDSINNITARLDRMKEILTELQIESSSHPDYQLLLPLMKLFEDEIPLSEFKVGSHELVNKPYENEALRLQKQREYEEKLKSLANNEAELLKQRALQDMMFGTLEMKKNLLLNEDLLIQKPDFMIENPEMTLQEMNEQQLKEFDAYQSKLKQLQEEQLHYKKTLEQEMKKLRGEIIDFCKTFNDKLLGLIQKKLLCNKVILSHEMYISRVALTMVKSEQFQSLIKSQDMELTNFRKDRLELKNRLELYHVKHEEMKNKLTILQEDERNMDKSFKRDLQNLCNNTFDIETLKVFTDLYRKRLYPKSALSSSLGDEDGGFGIHSESMDISASQSAANNKISGDGKNNATALNKKKGAGGDKLGTTKNSSRGGSRKGGGGGEGKGNRRLKASRGINASKETSSNNMGPMQQAAQQLLKSVAAAAANGGQVIQTNHLYDNDMIIAREKDPFYQSLLTVLKKKKKTEVVLPLQNPLSMELDCPEGFTVDQFSWLKMQELRTQRIEKEIEKSLLMNECNIMKTKLSSLDQEEGSLTNTINALRNLRDNYRKELKDMEINLDVLINLLQGQDEMNNDAMITDYSNGLLIPIIVVNKFNSRIKELGLEKINILTKIKLFRRKMNLISWEAISNGLQLKHFENYYTDLQLFRVTRDLQKVILEGENAFNQKVNRFRTLFEFF
jgi:WD40 repeat protein